MRDKARVERTPLRGLLSKAMELVDDDGDGKTAVATPRPVVDAPTTPSPAVATIPTPRPVVFAPTPSPSTATDPTMDRPTDALTTSPMEDATDPPTDADAPTIPLAEDETGPPVPLSVTPDDNDDGGSQLDVRVVVPADPVA